jgi:endoglucanase
MELKKTRYLIRISVCIALTGCGHAHDTSESTTQMVKHLVKDPMSRISLHAATPSAAEIAITSSAANRLSGSSQKPSLRGIDLTTLQSNNTPSATVSGITYHWRSQSPLENVLITSSQNTSAQTTSPDGLFSLPLAANAISSVTAQREASDAEVKQAITSADALAALKIAVGINPNQDPDDIGPLEALPVSPYQLIAADINGDGRVTSGDALGILKIAVGLSSAPEARWTFIDDSIGVWSTHANRSSVYVGTLSSSIDTSSRENIDFAAILAGDVNGSWTDSSDMASLDRSVFQSKSDETGAPMHLWGLRDANGLISFVFELAGAAEVSIEQGELFTDPGVNATGDGADTASIETSGTVGTLPGTYTLTYIATDRAGNTATLKRTVQVLAPEAATIRIEAEDYDAYADNTALNEGQTYRLTEGVDIELSNDSDGTYNVGWTDTGEWLEYIISVPVANHYSLSSRIAAPESGGFFSVSVDGVTLAHQSIIGTGDWQVWSTQTEYLGLLEAGEHRLRINIQRGLFNLNWLLLEPLNFDRIPTPEEAPTANTLASMMGLGVNIGQVFESIGANPPEFEPVRTKIDAYYELGFRTFRLPVTWTAAIEGRALVLDSNVGQIDPTHPRLATIQALVDYALSLGDTVVILNAHHEASIKDNQAAVVLERLWADIALLFQDRSHRLIYELLNEPHDSSGGTMPAAVLRDMSSRAYAQIRSQDPKRTIVISGNQWGGAWELNATWPSLVGVGDGLDPYLMATFHHYDPWTEFHSEDAANRAYPFTDDTLRNPMRTADEWRQRLGVDLPIYIGEWGVGWGKKQSSMNCNNVRLWYQSFPEAAAEFGMPTQVWDDGGWFEIFNYGSGAFSNNLAECITGTCDWEGIERFNQACYP